MEVVRRDAFVDRRRTPVLKHRRTPKVWISVGRHSERRALDFAPHALQVARSGHVVAFEDRTLEADIEVRIHLLSEGPPRFADSNILARCNG